MWSIKGCAAKDEKLDLLFFLGGEGENVTSSFQGGGEKRAG